MCFHLYVELFWFITFLYSSRNRVSGLKMHRENRCAKGSAGGLHFNLTFTMFMLYVPSALIQLYCRILRIRLSFLEL